MSIDDLMRRIEETERLIGVYRPAASPWDAQRKEEHRSSLREEEF